MQYRLTIDVFCHVEQTSNAGKALAEQRAFARCKVAVRDGGLARAVTHYADHPSPHLIIVEDAQAAKAFLRRIVVIAERKRVPAVEPTQASGAASVGGSNGDHGCSPLRLQ